MAHPKVFPEILLLPLDNPQNARHPASAFRRLARVHIRLVVAISDIDAPVSGNGMRVYGLSRGYTVLPLLLHLGMHHEKRVMRQVNGNLALGVRVADYVVVVVPRNYTADTELPGDAQGQGSDDCAWSEVGKLIAVPANTLLRSIIAVDKGRVWDPRAWGLKLELLTSGVARLDAILHFQVHSLLHLGFHLDKLRGDSSDILSNYMLDAEVPLPKQQRLTLSRAPL